MGEEETSAKEQICRTKRLAAMRAVLLDFPKGRWYNIDFNHLFHYWLLRRR
jgi:hypothetical protein